MSTLSSSKWSPSSGLFSREILSTSGRPNPIIIQSFLIRIILFMIILIRGKILQEHYHVKLQNEKSILFPYNLSIMMASSVVLRQRSSFLKILLWAKHTRGFLTNLLLGRKYFLCSNYTGCTNNKTNIRQKKYDSGILHHPRVTVKAQP